jgi:hypothetical protein
MAPSVCRSDFKPRRREAAEARFEADAARDAKGCTGTKRLLERNLATSDHHSVVITGLDPVISRSRRLMAGSSPAMTREGLDLMLL